MGEPRMLRIALPPGLPLLSANDRLHWTKTRKIGLAIKEEVVKAVRGEEPFTGKVRIRAIYHPPTTRGRRDPGNFYPTVKAAVDALVGQKDQVNKKTGKVYPAPPFVPLLADDSSRYVTEVALVVSSLVVAGGQMVIQVIEVIEDD